MPQVLTVPWVMNEIFGAFACEPEVVFFLHLTGSLMQRYKEFITDGNVDKFWERIDRESIEIAYLWAAKPSKSKHTLR